MTDTIAIAAEAAPDAGALQQHTHLRAILAAVAPLCGEPLPPEDDRAARAERYRTAPPVAQRRFDAIAAETEAGAAAGAAALARHRAATGRDCAAAAEQLSGEIRRALATLDAILRAD